MSRRWAALVATATAALLHPRGRLSSAGTFPDRAGARHATEEKTSIGLRCAVLAAGVSLAAHHQRRRTPRMQTGRALSPYAVATARLQVIGTCCLLLAQYALLLVFGVYGNELLDAGDANKLYAAASWGACFLAAPAGLCFDMLGPAWSTVIGGLLSTFGLGTAMLALSLQSAASLLLACSGYLLFGFGATLLNTVGLLAAVRIAPPRQSGKVAAAVLCSAALGMSVHTAVHARLCLGQPMRFMNYQILFSAVSSLLGLMMFKSSSWKTCLTEVENVEGDSSAASPASASSTTSVARIYSIINAKEFPFLAAIYMVPVAFSFAWLGNWTTCATRLGLPQEAQTRIGLSVGVFSAVGRLAFGFLADWAPPRRGLVGLELGFCGSLGLFVASFWLLSDARYFEVAMMLQSLGFGGVLCLAAVALRVGFSGEDLGTAFGFLYQILTVPFMVFNWAALPRGHCTGAECFKGFFHITGLLHAGCMFWAAQRLLRAWRRRVKVPD